MIELVPMAYRISAEVLLRDHALADDLTRQVSLAHGTMAPIPAPAASKVPKDGGLSVSSLPRLTASTTPASQPSTRKSTRLPDGRILRGLRDNQGELVGGAVAGIGGSLGGVGEEELREAALRRLESIGHRVGQGIAERYGSCRLRSPVIESLVLTILDLPQQVLPRSPQVPRHS